MSRFLTCRLGCLQWPPSFCVDELLICTAGAEGRGRSLCAGGIPVLSPFIPNVSFAYNSSGLGSSPPTELGSVDKPASHNNQPVVVVAVVSLGGDHGWSESWDTTPIPMTTRRHLVDRPMTLSCRGSGVPVGLTGGKGTTGI